MKRYATARDGRFRPDYLSDSFVEKVEDICLMEVVSTMTIRL